MSAWQNDNGISAVHTHYTTTSGISPGRWRLRCWGSFSATAPVQHSTKTWQVSGVCEKLLRKHVISRVLGSNSDWSVWSQISPRNNALAPQTCALSKECLQAHCQLKVKWSIQDKICNASDSLKRTFPCQKFSLLPRTPPPPPPPLVKHHPKLQSPSNLYKLITSCHLSVFWYSCFFPSANFLARCFDFILDFTKTQTAEILYKQSSKTTQFSTG